MKRILITILALLSITVSEAATNPKAVDIKDIEVVQSNGFVSVFFTINTGRKATKKDYNLVVNPVLQNGHNRLLLPSVVILGKRANINLERHSLNGYNSEYEKDYYNMTNNQSLHYETRFPYEAWMHGSRLVFEGVSVGCCSSKEVLMGTMAENLLVTPQIETPAPAYPSFVQPVSQYQEGMFDRTGSITVHFRQAKIDIDPRLFNNEWSLSQILYSVRQLQESGVHRIARIVIAGFASPEGTIAINYRLGRDRGQVIKDYIVKNTGLNPNMVGTFNGEVDWTGLREFVVNSDMPSRYRVLDIIDNTPVKDSSGTRAIRLGELQRLGEPYRYMYRTYFPLLRQAAYIKIYYDDK